MYQPEAKANKHKLMPINTQFSKLQTICELTIWITIPFSPSQSGLIKHIAEECVLIENLMGFKT